MAVSNSFLTGIAERGPEAAPPVEADSPPGSERAAALDASAESPRRVWLFVDLEVFGRACGLFGRDLQSAWARWWVIAEARDGIWGTVDEPTIGLELEVLRQPPCVTGVGECGREASMSVSAFARGGSSGRADATASRSDRLWLFFDFSLFRRASGLRGRDLQSAWSRWWTLAEACGEICGTFDEPKIGVAVEELSVFRESASV